MDNTFPKHEKKVNAIFEELSDQELEIFINLLKRVGIHAKDI